MNYIDKYSLIPFFLFSFFVPIYLPASNVFLALSIFIVVFKIDKKNVTYNYKFFLTSTAMLFFAYVLGVFYSDNFSTGFNFLGRIATFLIIPLVLGFKSKLDFRKVQKSLFFGLTISLFFVCLFLLINVLINYIDAENFTLRYLFSYRYTTQKFVLPLHDSHPTYLGLYILVSSAMWEFNHYKLAKEIQIVIYSVFFVSLLFLNSRIVFIAALIYALFYVFLKLKSKKQRLIVLGTGLFLMVSMLYVLKDTYFVKKWQRGIVWDLTENVGNSNTTKKLVSDSRMARWQVAVEKVLEKPFFGYGTGMEMTVLKEAYIENEMFFSFEKKYNSHNQYLNYLIELGLMGLTVFFFFLTFNSYQAIKTKKYEQLLLIVFVICISTTENVLVRNMGITFFAMFFAINKIALSNENQ
tara:strand:- start:427 stop:1656 length:1230 start_codon:yes stop_codon:yes gene_type:complete